MARKERFTREELIDGGVEFIRLNGIEKLNVRDLAKFIGCSTQPIFRNYSNIEEYKGDLKKALHKDYEKFIDKYIKKDKYLLTISYGYALYAKKESNIFRALFITSLAGTRTVKEVINSPWNRETIEYTSKVFNISIEEAETLYRDVRFYTHGIATQLSCNSIKLSDKELYSLIENMINKLL